MIKINTARRMLTTGATELLNKGSLAFVDWL
jgi:hypothetical protein